MDLADFIWAVLVALRDALFPVQVAAYVGSNPGFLEQARHWISENFVGVAALAIAVVALRSPRPLAPQPKLEVKLEFEDDAEIARLARPMVFFDVDAIVAAEFKKARATVPFDAERAEAQSKEAQKQIEEARTPLQRSMLTVRQVALAAVTPGSIMGATAAALGRSGPTSAEITRGRERLERSLKGYEPELRAWLERYAAHAVLEARRVRLRPVIANAGAAARSLRVDVTLDDGIKHAETTDLAEPPARPAYRDPTSSLREAIEMRPPLYRGGPGPMFAPRREPTFRMQTGRLTWRHDQTVLHKGISERGEIDELLLEPDARAVTLTWEARADNLRRPKTGPSAPLKLPKRGEPRRATTLAELLELDAAVALED